MILQTSEASLDVHDSPGTWLGHGRGRPRYLEILDRCCGTSSVKTFSYLRHNRRRTDAETDISIWSQDTSKEKPQQSFEAVC
jgi:hypothetical protein